MKGKSRVFLLLISSMLLVSPMIDNAQVQASSVTAYHEYSSSYSYDNQIPVAKPRWSAVMDRPTETSRYQHQVVTNKNQVILIQGGKITALDLKSGKKLWTAGQKMIAPIIATGEYIYASSLDGQIYQMNAKSGKVSWKVNTANLDEKRQSSVVHAVSRR